MTGNSHNFMEVLDKLPVYSPLWHQLLYQGGKDFFGSCEPETLASNPVLQELHELFTKYDGENWQYSIDTLTPETITGWAHFTGPADTPALDLWANDTLLAKEFKPRIFRPDVKAGGFGDGCCGFAVACGRWVPTFRPVLIKLTLAGTDNVIGFRYFDLKGCSHSWDLLKFAEINLKMGRVEDALAYYYQLVLYVPFYQDMLNAIDRYKLLREDDGKKEEWHKQELKFATSGLKEYGKNSRDVLVDALNKMYIFGIEPQNNEEIAEVLFVFKQLLALDKNKLLDVAYNNFLIHYVLNKEIDKTGNLNFFKDKICLGVNSYNHFRYIRDVMRAFPLKIFEILVYIGGREGEVFQRDLPGVPVRPLDGNEHRYSVLLLDYIEYEYSPNLKKLFKDKRLIGYLHGTWENNPPISDESLIIMPTLGHLQRPDILLASETCHNLSARKNKNIHTCEMAYTGPSHEGEFLRQERRCKDDMRHLVEKELKCKLPSDKPLVVCISGSIKYTAERLAAMSYLAGSCALIYRPFFRELPVPGLTVPENIMVAGELRVLPNTIRFAADYVLAEIDKSSFLTCLMFGVPVIPYFTDPVWRAIIRDARSGQTLFSGQRPITNKILGIWPQIFDINNPQPIRDAIISGEYLRWFQENIDNIQKEVFLDYHLDGAVELTAEYIMRFASEGSLGKDCAGLAIV